MKKCTAVLLALALLGAVVACGKPTTAAGWLELGEKYLFDLDYEQALVALEQAILIEPKNPRHRVEVIIVYVLADNPAGAQQAQQQAQDDDVPGFPALPPIPDSPADLAPEEFFPPVIDWFSDNGWADFVRRLLELLRRRWPEASWLPPSMIESQTVVVPAVEISTRIAREPSVERITIRGKEYSTSLTKLTLKDMGLTNEDIAPLAEMTNLTELELYMNEISDLSPLSELYNLQTLNLHSNKISDLSPLQNLTGLEHLLLMNNQIVSVSALAGLGNLKYLKLWENQIVDVSPIANLVQLRNLTLNENRITDIRPLAGLTSMIVLDISDNPISDISAVANMREMIQLIADNTDVDDWSPSDHIGSVIK